MALIFPPQQKRGSFSSPLLQRVAENKASVLAALGAGFEVQQLQASVHDISKPTGKGEVKDVSTVPRFQGGYRGWRTREKERWSRLALLLQSCYKNGLQPRDHKVLCDFPRWIWRGGFLSDETQTQLHRSRRHSTQKIQGSLNSRINGLFVWPELFISTCVSISSTSLHVV